MGEIPKISIDDWQKEQQNKRPEEPKKSASDKAAEAIVNIIAFVIAGAFLLGLGYWIITTMTEPKPKNTCYTQEECEELDKRLRQEYEENKYRNENRPYYY